MCAVAIYCMRVYYIVLWCILNSPTLSVECLRARGYIKSPLTPSTRGTRPDAHVPFGRARLASPRRPVLRPRLTSPRHVSYCGVLGPEDPFRIGPISGLPGGQIRHPSCRAPRNREPLCRHPEVGHTYASLSDIGIPNAATRDESNHIASAKLHQQREGNAWQQLYVDIIRNSKRQPQGQSIPRHGNHNQTNTTQRGRAT